MIWLCTDKHCINNTSIFKCDLMGQNQSHVAIFPCGVKYTSF